jgi:GR25 family glycosyltransferase involved in LPS biosynthesis
MTSNQLFLKGLALVLASFLLLSFLRSEPPPTHEHGTLFYEDERKEEQPTIQANKYVVKAIVLPSREDQAMEHLEKVFPVVDFVEGFDKTKLDLGLMESAKTFDKTWDYKDHRIREAYSQDYCQEGEVACTLAHRRALEDFLHKDPETEVALLLEDDSVPISPTILEEINELLTVAPKGWDFIQLGRCWDLWCDREEEEDPVVSFGGTDKETIALHESRGFELCSHAYLVTRKGAEKILQYSLPVMLPFVRAQRGNMCFIPSNYGLTSSSLLVEGPYLDVVGTRRNPR